MKKKIVNPFVLLVTFLLSLIYVKAQQWQAYGGLGTNTQTPSKIIHISNNGTAYKLGYFYNNITGVGSYSVQNSTGTKWNIKARIVKDTPIYTIVTDNAGNIYAAGNFLNANGKLFVAKAVGNNWVEVGTNTTFFGAAGSITKLIVDQYNNLYAIGNFTNANGHCFVAKFNGTNWSELGGNDALKANAIINSIYIDINDNIYVAGNFRNASNNYYVAKFNGTSWSEVGNLSSINNANLHSLCVDNMGNIYIGIRNKNSFLYELAKFNGSSWINIPIANATTNGVINSLCVDSKNNIYATGLFKKQFFFNNADEPYIAQYDGSNWSEKGGYIGTGISQNPVQEIYDVTVDGFDNIYAATDYLAINGNNIIKWTAPIAPPAITISCNTLSVCKGTTVTIKTTTPTITNSTLFYTYYKNNSIISFGNNLDTIKNAILNDGDSVWCVLKLNSTYYSPNTVKSNVLYFKTKPTPSLVNNISGKTVSCKIGEKNQLSIAEIGGVWSVSDVSIATINNTGQATAVSNGNTIITYTVTNANGCSASTATLYSVASISVTPITGANNVCVGATTQLLNATAGGVWSSLNNRASIDDATGVLTGLSGGGVTASIKYTVTNVYGCSAVANYALTVNSLPNVPSIGYAPGTINPQAGAGGAFCANRTFTVVGTPNGGIWSSTGVLSVTNGGVANTGAIAGGGSLTYTYTNLNGCSNSRTIVSNVVVCASRGVNGINNGQVTIDNERWTMFPNPAKSFISLQVNTLIGTGSIIISDLYGKQVKTQTLSMGDNIIDISNFSKGIYIVSVITSEGKMTKKLVVE